MRGSRRVLPFIILALALLVSGCRTGLDFSPSLEYPLAGLPGGEVLLNRQVLGEYADFAGEDGSIRLEQVFYGLGARAIDRIEIRTADGELLDFDWGEVAETTRFEKDVSITVGDLNFAPAAVSLVRSPLEAGVEAAIYDIAPTTAAALGIPAPELASGRILADYYADAVLLLFLDAFGYIRFQESLADGLIPCLAGLDPPLAGLTTYPPATTISSASLLTGTEPYRHGVETRGIRSTDQQTLLDIASAAGLRVVAVEGEAVSFNLRGAEIILSGDRDGSGGTDDNVLANALAVLEEEGMPDLFLVHFHGIDDTGHTYGPGAQQEEEKITEVDGAVCRILDNLPSDTLVIIFADHGMHHVSGESRLGNHGNLVARDMLIPIWIHWIE